MSEPTHPDSHRFEELLLYLKQMRGFDFTGYKRPSLQRRITRRMESLDIKAFEEYQDYLEVHAEEFATLFDTILINVTEFFRDKEAWNYIEEHVIPAIVSDKLPGGTIRVWSAGCASGAEAYTLAMLFAEAVGDQQFREQVKIYATDADEPALNYARHATYTAKELEGVPEPLRDKYFDENGGRIAFRADLRHSVIFGHHNLTQDAPISRLDLLVCRNTLMYFNAEAQAQILARFHFALNPGGRLFLGRAEMLTMHTSFFAPVEMQYRLFRKVPLTQQERLPLLGPLGRLEVARGERGQTLRQVAFEALPVPAVVTDIKGVVAAANAEARRVFKLTSGDVGRPFYELELSYRPVELRSRIEQVLAEKHAIRLPTVEWHPSLGEIRFLDIEIIPILDDERDLLGTCLVFDDVTIARQLRLDLQRSHEELETAYEELQSTNEELETTNEELQSTIEELETTNEELQSTNEELETMNEELHTINEEVRASNAELQNRTDQLNKANALLESIVNSIGEGVIVLDRKLGVIIWNSQAEELWGLRTNETQGQSFATLDIGLPTSSLIAPIKRVLDENANLEELSLKAVNRRGRPANVEVLVSPLKSPAGAIEGAILLLKSTDGAQGET